MENLPPAVRVLPMNLDDEFPDEYTIVDAQNWFLSYLAQREHGEYHCYRVLREDPGAVVLFQCAGFVVASAVLNKFERYAEADEDGYVACLFFDVDSIRVFDEVDAQSMRNIWPDFNRFAQVMWDLDPKRYADFERTLVNVRQPRSTGE